jgi:hypothetical protein
MPKNMSSVERLYNGIELTDPWPPKIEKLTMEPPAVPYLKNPPQTILIDVGRQLFVDNFLIEKTDMDRVYHSPVPCPDNPVLRPEKPWEFVKGAAGFEQFPGPLAYAFSDGAWYDPKDQLYKMWYIGGGMGCTCYATSGDGIHWEKPSLDVRPGTNIVHTQRRDSSTVWLDLEEQDPAKRFKLFWSRILESCDAHIQFCYQTSPDGIHWSPILVESPGMDRTTAFYNPFRKKWVGSLREVDPDPLFCRVRRYREADDAMTMMTWGKLDENPLWVCADRLDPPHPGHNLQPQLYNLDAVAYESLMVGFFSIWEGDAYRDLGRPKRNEIFLGFSRDGFHWDRPWRKPFIGVSDTPGDWNWGNIQSVGGGCLVVGDKLYFYYSGRAGNGRLGKDESWWDSDVAMGLAILRRDGFASIDAGAIEGFLLTRPVQFTGRHLFVNADIAGELKVEVLNENNESIPGLTREDCAPIQGDNTRHAVTWKNARDVSGAGGKRVRFKFHLTSGRLYSFWVSSDKSGASGGYVGAGGPGFAGAKDAAKQGKG